MRLHDIKIGVNSEGVSRIIQNLDVPADDRRGRHGNHGDDLNDRDRGRNADQSICGKGGHEVKPSASVRKRISPVPQIPRTEACDDPPRSAHNAFQATPRTPSKMIIGYTILTCQAFFKPRNR